MRWLKRGLWLAGWGVWAWLGVGLYRELPRQLSPALCQVRLAEGERPWGFLDDREMVTQVAAENKRTQFRFYDLGGGQVTRTLDGPFGPADRESAESNAVLVPRHGLFLTTRRDAAPPRWWESRADPKQSVLNLRSGVWVDLPTGIRAEHPVLHPEQPWAIYESSQRFVRVVDLATGALLFSWDGEERDQPRRLGAMPFFVGASHIGIPTEPPHYKGKLGDHSTEEVELWSIPAGPSPKRLFKGLHVGNDPASSSSGRVAWHQAGNRGWLDVFDFDEGRKVFEFPPNRGEPKGDYMGSWPGPTLAPDGKAVLSRTNHTLWNVDAGDEIWKEANRREKLCGIDDDEFEVEERWWTDIIDSETWRIEAYAVRDFHTGALHYRCWHPPFGRPRSIVGGRGIAFDGENIYLLPPPPNYPLLALCQSILALPLALTWLVFRWRRKRRLRMAGAAS